MKEFRKIKIGDVVYDDESYPLYYSDIDGFNIAVADLTNKEILISDEFLRLEELCQKFIIYHELGHIVKDSDDEVVADKFALSHIGFDDFESAVDMLYKSSINNIRYVKTKCIFRSFCIYRVNSMVNQEVKKEEKEYTIKYTDNFEYVKENLAKGFDKIYKKVGARV